MKIIVSDFDYTFFTDDYEHNIQIIQEFVQKGNLFIIATGRNLDHIRADIDGYSIPFSYLICNDGGLIYNHQYQLLYEKKMKPEIVKPVFEFLDQKRCFSEVWVDHNGEYSVDPNESADKIIARYKDAKKAQKIVEEVCTKFSGITGYLSEHWVNLTDISVNKGRAIQQLAIENHWNSEDIYTVGDSVNDISMVTMYRGYAIATGSDALKKVSIKTVKDFEELIRIIEHESTEY